MLFIKFLQFIYFLLKKLVQFIIYKPLFVDLTFFSFTKKGKLNSFPFLMLYSFFVYSIIIFFVAFLFPSVKTIIYMPDCAFFKFIFLRSVEFLNDVLKIFRPLRSKISTVTSVFEYVFNCRVNSPLLGLGYTLKLEISSSSTDSEAKTFTV